VGAKRGFRLRCPVSCGGRARADLVYRLHFSGEAHAKRNSKVVQSDQGLRFHPARRWVQGCLRPYLRRLKGRLYVAGRRSQGDVRHCAEPRQGERRKSADCVRPITRMFLTVMAVARCEPNSYTARTHRGSKSIGPVCDVGASSPWNVPSTPELTGGLSLSPTGRGPARRPSLPSSIGWRRRASRNPPPSLAFPVLGASLSVPRLPARPPVR
jgi:hypothetical protein